MLELVEEGSHAFPVVSLGVAHVGEVSIRVFDTVFAKHVMAAHAPATRKRTRPAFAVCARYLRHQLFDAIDTHYDLVDFNPRSRRNETEFALFSLLL